MPLTTFQAKLAKLLAKNRTPDSYLAGGAALHLAPYSKRFSNDLDYFHDSEERVDSAFADDIALLENEHYEVKILMRKSGFFRAVVSLQGQSTKVEWAHDSAWRFLPTQVSMEAGYLLNPIDLGLNKLLALVGRDEPRDYIDIHVVISTVLPLGALCWAAAGKDPGFTPMMLLELLRRRGKIRPEDIHRLSLVEPVDLIQLKMTWLKQLEEAEIFIQSRNPAESGCLYYSKTQKKFIQPATEDLVTPHYGKPGGIIPAYMV
jgi:hypothetical protein